MEPQPGGDRAVSQFLAALTRGSLRAWGLVVLGLLVIVNLVALVRVVLD